MKTNMPKDLLEKFDKQFDEQFEYKQWNESDSGFFVLIDKADGNPMAIEQVKSLAHSHIEAAYQSNLERLIEKCGDYFGAAIKTENGWKVGNVDFEETLPGSMPIGTGKTFTEAVENLIKALEK